VTRSGPAGPLAFRFGALALVAMLLILPIAAGLWETGRAAFGLLPALGASGVSLGPWRELFDLPGVERAAALSLFTGLAATILSFIIAAGAVAAITGRAAGAVPRRLVALFLAAPHAALAIGLSFLLAPSGWIARAIAPFAGLDRPPVVASVNDAAGLALILGLCIKEVPFLILVMLSAVAQISPARQTAAARALGYRPALVWAKVILPQLWPLVRLPVMVVLAYGVSVVDMAIILGPSNPPTLAVMLTRLFASPDLAQMMPAAAGAMVQVGIAALALAMLWGGGRLVALLWRGWIRRGERGGAGAALFAAAASGAVVLAGLGLAALVALALWSVAWRWPWPGLLPQSWSLAAWSGAVGNWGGAALNTVLLAVLSTGLSILLAIIWLEAEQDAFEDAPRRRGLWLELAIYLPLIIPQIGFLFGLNALLIRLGFSGGMLAVAWCHAIFVFPYVMIALSDPWRRLDPRLLRRAAALGAGRWRRLWAVRLPILLGPLATAAAIGVAVSVAQYLPTLFAGGGRISTLTTEAVALSAGSDRRVAAVHAVLQALLPFLAFLAAFALPAMVHRNRRALPGAVGR
jgi:putative thiamine transport system permease protein